jgi:hypothetical protein
LSIVESVGEDLAPEISGSASYPPLSIQMMESLSEINILGYIQNESFVYLSELLGKTGDPSTKISPHTRSNLKYVDWSCRGGH